MVLKRCPFCGGKARVITRFSEKTEKYYVNVKCFRCKAESTIVSSDTWPKEDSETAQRAVDAWNTRYKS